MKSHKAQAQLVELTAINLRWVSENLVVPPGMMVEVTLSLVPQRTVEVRFNDATSSPEILDRVLSQPVGNLIIKNFETRIRSSMYNVGFVTIGEVTRKTEQEVLKWRNFGKKSLESLQESLEFFGLSLGMKVPIGPHEKAALLQSPIGRLTWLIPYKLREYLEGVGFRTFEDLLDENRKVRLMEILGSYSPGREDEDSRWHTTYPTPETRYENVISLVKGIVG